MASAVTSSITMQCVIDPVIKCMVGVLFLPMAGEARRWQRLGGRRRPDFGGFGGAKRPGREASVSDRFARHASRVSSSRPFAPRENRGKVNENGD
jgi:hypothetical protein